MTCTGCDATVPAYDPDDSALSERLCPRCWDEWLDLRHEYDDERDRAEWDGDRRLNEERESGRRGSASPD